MVGLLNLPLELREPILLDVILDTTQDQPQDFGSANRDTGFGFTHGSEVSCAQWGFVLYRPLQRHAMALLHINQQIREEVMDLVPRRLGQQMSDAKVDLILIKEVEFYRSLCATWLSAPFPTRHFDTVRAQIRYFQEPISPESHLRNHPAASREADCNAWVESASAKMLLNFLAESHVMQDSEVNTSVDDTQRPKDSSGTWVANRTIQNLVIDIPFDPDPQALLDAWVRCAWCSDANDDILNNRLQQMIPSGKRAALLFAQSLHEQLLKTFEFAPKYFRKYNFPRVVLERVGTIDLKVGGRLFRSLDLGQVLANLPHNEEWTADDFSRAEYFEWKRSAEEKRKAFGFKEIRPSAQEHELVGPAGLIASMLTQRCGSLVRNVATLSEDTAPSSIQPSRDEMIAFTGEALFFQDKGNGPAGNATFYCSTHLTLENAHLHVPNLRPVVDHSERYYPERDIGELPKDGEVVLFQGEAILFQSSRWTSTITSGDATFYGRAEEASTEQPDSIEAVSTQGWYPHATRDT